MQERVYSQSVPIAVETCDVFARHGEEVLRARYWPGVADRGFQWPATGVTFDNFREKEVIVAGADGVVVGRAILDAVFYPLAELENLEVAPAYRGQGVGGAIVRHAIEAAARAGFLAIHAQTFKNNLAAHRLYARHGFLPATRGEMLRVWKFFNLPVLSQFLHEHPMALFESAPGAGTREHILRWHEPLAQDELTVTITGGSCQFDSGGVGPAVSRLRLRSGSAWLEATLGADQPAAADRCFEVSLALANHGSQELAGGFRIGLNPGFRIAGGHPGGEQFSLPPGSNLDRTVMVELTGSFPADLLRISSYQSVPVSVDFLLGDHTFWLMTQVPIDNEGQAAERE